MDGVDDAVGVIEPELVAPFVRIAVAVMRVVVVDQVAVCKVCGKG